MFDIYPYKVKESLKKTGKVVLWVLASGALSALYAYTKDIEINATNTMLASGMGFANIVLFFALDQLRSIDPRRAAKKVTGEVSSQPAN